MPHQSRLNAAGGMPQGMRSRKRPVLRPRLESQRARVAGAAMNRLKNIEEVFELGLEDALKYGVALIEWPELIEDVLKVSNKVTINFQNSSNNRIAEVTTEGVFCKNKSLNRRYHK